MATKIRVLIRLEKACLLTNIDTFGGAVDLPRTFLLITEEYFECNVLHGTEFGNESIGSGLMPSEQLGIASKPNETT
jgi:hypothetical protein